VDETIAHPGRHDPETGRDGEEPRPALAGRVVRRLEMQGFSCSTDPSVRAVVPWLRFSPGLTTVGAAIGTVLAAPAVLGALALVTGTCAATPRHPFDHVYERVVRPVTGTPALPENEPPRRFACALATVWLVATAVAFWNGAAIVGYALGSLLVVLGGLVATTHFCFGSLVYRAVQRRLPTVGAGA